MRRPLPLLALALAAGAWQAPPPGRTVAVFIDVSAETADAQASAGLRERALEHVERTMRPAYVELSRTGARAVPDAERDAFRRTRFGVTPPRYDGVNLTVGEAVEILRGNDSVRDTVIARECPSLADCGRAVAVAAQTRATRDGDDGTREMLRHVVRGVAASGATTVVVVSAGWPYRDARRAGIDEAVRQLRAAGTHLIVLRLAGRERYDGPVKDASETLARQLAVDFASLATADDAARVDARFAAALPPAADRPPADAHGAAGEASPAVATSAPAADDLPLVTGLPADLVRAAAYVDRFERTFSSVVWRERHLQEVRVQRQFMSSGARFSALAARRRLDSEFFFLWLPVDRSWIAVRDVIAVDGRERAEHERRLPALLRDRGASTALLRTLAAENGRYDIGTIVRTFTEPTLVLLFLDPHYRQRFAFARHGSERRDGRQVARYDFVERARPTVIRNGNRDAVATGRLTVDVASGEILETVLELRVPDAQLLAQVTVRFGRQPRFDVLVPVSASEIYDSPTERVTAEATYSDFRRFETAARLVP